MPYVYVILNKQLQINFYKRSVLTVVKQIKVFIVEMRLSTIVVSEIWIIRA